MVLDIVSISIFLAVILLCVSLSVYSAIEIESDNDDF